MSTLLAILVANTLVAAALAGIAWLAYRFARSPSLAHFFWVLALLKLVTPPLAPVPVGWTLRPEAYFVESVPRTNELPLNKPAFVEPRRTTTASSSSVAPTGKSDVGHSQDMERGARRRLKIPCTWQAFATGFGLLWVLGSACFAILLAWRARAFQHSLDRCTSPDGELSRRTWRLARRAGLQHAPQVLVVDALLSPMLWGIGRRVKLIFPAGLRGRLSDDEVDSLLLHELGHYARGDHWVRVLELISRIVLWWHPLTWLALRQIGQVEEHCCDAWVVSQQVGRERSYAEALLATIDFLNEECVLAPPVTSGLGDARLLRRRLTDIMAGTTPLAPSSASQRLAWATGCALLILHPALGTASLPSFSFPRLTEHASLAPQSAATAHSTPESSPQSPIARPEPANALVTPERPLNSNPIRPPATLWASVTSPGAVYRIEARAGRRTTLVHLALGKQIDLSTYRITCVAFKPDHHSFFTGDEEGHIREWDSQTGGLLHWWKGHLKEVTSIHVSPDGAHLASGSLDGLVEIWRTADHEEVHRLQWRQDVISCVRWSADSKQLGVCVGGWSESVHPELIVWNLKEGLETQRLELEQPAGAIAWLKDPHLLMTSAWDGRTTIWDMAAGSQLAATMVRKEEVSAAAWCAQCPLVLRFAQEEVP